MTGTYSASRAARATPAAVLSPPEHLDPLAREMFLEAVRSKPGFFTEADVHMLGSYALAASIVRRMEVDPVAMKATPDSYDKVIRRMISLAKALRLAPSTRATKDQAVGTPTAATAMAALKAAASGAVEPDAVLNDANGTRSARAALNPWDTPAEAA